VQNLKMFLLLLFSVVSAVVVGMGVAGLMTLFSDVSGFHIRHDFIVGASCTLAGIFLGALYQKRCTLPEARYRRQEEVLVILSCRADRLFRMLAGAFVNCFPERIVPVGEKIHNVGETDDADESVVADHRQPFHFPLAHQPADVPY